jgi:hypothetical protein
MSNNYSNHEQNELYLLVLLDDQLKLKITKNLLTSFSLESGKVYTDHNDDTWTGFYDWLRNKKTEIIGVRSFFFEHYSYMLNLIKPLQYLSINECNKSIEIYFQEEKNFDSEWSTDQHFGKNRIFSTESGDLALSFGIYPTLSVFEIESIKKQVAFSKIS